jgi:hypothetical protein
MLLPVREVLARGPASGKATPPHAGICDAVSLARYRATGGRPQLRAREERIAPRRLARPFVRPFRRHRAALPATGVSPRAGKPRRNAASDTLRPGANERGLSWGQVCIPRRWYLAVSSLRTRGGDAVRGHGAVDHSFDYSAGGLPWIAVEERWAICGVVAPTWISVGVRG